MRKLLVIGAVLAALLTVGSIAHAGCNPTMQHYHALKIGMTLEQADAAVGCWAKEMSRGGTGPYEVVSYIYTQPDGIGNIVMMFSKGKLMTKAQTLLDK